MFSDKKFYTTGEIAKIIGISQQTVTNYCEHAKIIIVTGYATEENKKRLQKFNIEAVLEKPFNIKKLRSIVSSFLPVYSTE